MIFDVIVIGAGINGSASAYELRNNQHKNTLLLEQVSKDTALETLLFPFTIFNFEHSKVYEDYLRMLTNGYKIRGLARKPAKSMSESGFHDHIKK